MEGNASVSARPIGTGHRPWSAVVCCWCTAEAVRAALQNRETGGMTVTKRQWRAHLLQRRRVRPERERRAARRAVSQALLADLTTPGEPAASTGDPMTVCLFCPLPTEPLAPDLPGRLSRAGLRVLVPVARRGEPLDWCELDPAGALAPGMLGVPEPTGPRLGPTAIRLAAVVLVPALAVDAAGVRLGRGGGHYDRSLALLDGPVDGPARRPRVIAVVFDDELVHRLPHDAHDVAVTEVLTPGGGLRRLPGHVA